MSEPPSDDAPPEPPAGARSGQAAPDEVERLLARAEATGKKSLVQLIPRRDVTLIVLLVVLLAVIVAVQQRSGSIAKALTDGLFPAPTPKTQPREPPRVRLAPPQP